MKVEKTVDKNQLQKLAVDEISLARRLVDFKIDGSE
jgi:hypothetical protein